jgi:hypothetical protein
VFNVNLTSSECCQEIDFGMIEKVIIFALETGMRLLFNFEHDITWFDTR